jgi:hypothetical protein
VKDLDNTNLITATTTYLSNQIWERLEEEKTKG